MAIFKGAGVAIVTPMNEDGSVNYEKFGELIEFDIPYLRLNNMEHVDEVLDTFLAEDNTMLLECLIDPMDLVK